MPAPGAEIVIEVFCETAEGKLGPEIGEGEEVPKSYEALVGPGLPLTASPY